MMLPLDETLLRSVNGMRSPALDPGAAWLSEWGLYVGPAALVAVALWRRSRTAAADARDGALVFFLALFVAETALKPWLRRPRPTAVLHALRVLGPTPSPRSWSLPSGTATACWAVAAWVWLRWGPRAGMCAAIFAGVVSLARLYAGVHWPSDLLAGALVGALVAVGVHWLSRWVELGRG
ncbi:MAG: phosphatase PAP2 family protein [Deltaproteobacteria bacterium]|nr:phosphatase PAP2 family protein [Deltaproteobacteria bacterium]